MNNGINYSQEDNELINKLLFLRRRSMISEVDYNQKLAIINKKYQNTEIISKKTKVEEEEELLDQKDREFLKKLEYLKKKNLISEKDYIEKKNIFIKGKKKLLNQDGLDEQKQKQEELEKQKQEEKIKEEKIKEEKIKEEKLKQEKEKMEMEKKKKEEIEKKMELEKKKEMEKKKELEIEITSPRSIKKQIIREELVGIRGLRDKLAIKCGKQESPNIVEFDEYDMDVTDMVSLEKSYYLFENGNIKEEDLMKKKYSIKKKYSDKPKETEKTIEEKKDEKKTEKEESNEHTTINNIKIPNLDLKRKTKEKLQEALKKEEERIKKERERLIDQEMKIQLIKNAVKQDSSQQDTSLEAMKRLLEKQLKSMNENSDEDDSEDDGEDDISSNNEYDLLEENDKRLIDELDYRYSKNEITKEEHKREKAKIYSKVERKKDIDMLKKVDDLLSNNDEEESDDDEKEDEQDLSWDELDDLIAQYDKEHQDEFNEMLRRSLRRSLRKSLKKLEEGKEDEKNMKKILKKTKKIKEKLELIDTKTSQHSPKKFGLFDVFKGSKKNNEEIDNNKLFGTSLNIVMKRESEKKEIPNVIDDVLMYIVDNGIYTEDIFVKEGNREDIVKIKDKVENGNILVSQLKPNIHNVSYFLLYYLNELGQPIIPSFLYDSFLDMFELVEKDEKIRLCKLLIYDKMNVNYKNLLKRIIEVLYILSKSSKTNLMNSKR
jgi:hypothetical protein